MTARQQVRNGIQPIGQSQQVQCPQPGKLCGLLGTFYIVLNLCCSTHFKHLSGTFCRRYVIDTSCLMTFCKSLWMVSWMVSFLDRVFYSGLVSCRAGSTEGNISQTHMSRKLDLWIYNKETSLPCCVSVWMHWRVKRSPCFWSSCHHRNQSITFDLNNNAPTQREEHTPISLNLRLVALPPPHTHPFMF